MGVFFTNKDSFSLGKNKSNINFFKNQILFKYVYVYVWFREDDQKMIFYYYILLLLV